MNAAEVVVYDLKIERAALVRKANAYARGLRSIEQYHDDCRARLEARHGHDLHGRRYRDKVNKQAAAYERAVVDLNERYALGNCAAELAACDASIMKATAALHRFGVDNLKPDERFSTFEINTGGVN
jgi:hypothetical protein